MLYLGKFLEMGKTVRKEFPVTGLSCASCAISVESMLKEQKGVLNASVNYANSLAQVEFEPAIVQGEDLKSIIQSIGYDLLIENNGQNSKKSSSRNIPGNSKQKQSGLLSYRCP